MRISIRSQLPIVHPGIDHEHARELQKISDILDDEPGIIDLVMKDLVPDDVAVDLGRKGMTAEQVIRALIVKMMNGYSYEQLAFHLADSQTYRAFCRIGVFDTPPSKSALQSNIKRIRPRTLELINRILVMYAIEAGIERSDKVRIDTTVTEANIHHPTDSSLLWDCVRVMTRIMHKATELVGYEFVDHRRRAKRRTMEILNAKTNKERLNPYKHLLRVTLDVVDDAERAVSALRKCSIKELRNWLAAMHHADELVDSNII
jgi:IS5 family transposase